MDVMNYKSVITERCKQAYPGNFWSFSDLISTGSIPKYSSMFAREVMFLNIFETLLTSIQASVADTRT